MIVETPSGRLRVVFWYPTSRRGRAVCASVEEPLDEMAEDLLWRTLGNGLADCAPGDQFVKETGRKLALTRALAGMKRETRRAVWAAYLNRRAIPVAEMNARLRALP